MLWLLTAVKTGYPLTSITSLYRGLKCGPIEVEYFLKLSADNLPVSDDRRLKFIFPMIHMKYVVFISLWPRTIKILVSNWPRTRKFSQFFKNTAGEDILNSASRILQCWSYYVKINSARHQHDTERTQTERDRSHGQLFHPLWGSSVWRNVQRSGSDQKISAHSVFSPDLELLTPTESRHTTCLQGGKSPSVKSPSVKLMSGRENKELAKTNLKNMDKTMQKLQHIGSIKDLRPKNS